MLQIAARRPVTPVPAWYGECFRTALRRVAALLNSCEPYMRCARADLRLCDADLDSLFERNRWDEKVIQFHVGDKDPFTALDDEYSAEYFFYCDVDFPARRNDRVAKFIVPTPFLEWGHRRLRRPEGLAEELELDRFGGSIDAPEFVRQCATNYLVKNFWHNFTHRAIQGITTYNYHQFRGPAREDSDFEADNVANILLVRAYGLPVLSRGAVGASNAARIEALFRRNRCNLIFAERAQHRRTDRANMGIEVRWSEMEWRFCRAVANALSIRLIGMGLAVPSLRIFFNGDLKTADGGARRWREGTVVVEIAGRRIDTGVPPYLPDDELRSESASAEGDVVETTPDRLEMIRSRRSKREAEIVRIAVAAFGGLMRDRALRNSVVATMDALAQRISIPKLQST